MKTEKAKHRGLSAKITRLVLTLTLLALFVISTAALAVVGLTEGLAADVGNQIGRLAAANMKDALLAQARQELMGVCYNKTEYIQQKFDETASSVRQISDAVTLMYSAPQNYVPRAVFPPDKANTGTVTPQLMFSETADRNSEALRKEVALTANIQDLLTAAVKYSDMSTAAYIATKSGIVIMSDANSDRKFKNGEDTPLPYEAFVRPWYIQASKANDLIFTDVMYDIHGGGATIVCAAPFYKDGEFMGVAGAGAFLTSINRAVSTARVGTQGYAFVIDSDGKVNISPTRKGELSASPDNNYDLRGSSNKELAAAAEDMTKGGSDFVSLVIDGKKSYLAYAPMTKPDWSFGLVVPESQVLKLANESSQNISALTLFATDEMNRHVQALLLTVAVILAAVILVVAITAKRWSRHISEPLQLLMQSVEDIGRGELDISISLNTGDEIEKLGDAFTDMARELREYIEHVTQITAEKEREGAEMSIAARIQFSMLPGDFNSLSKYADVFGVMQPAREIGGDFFDCFMVDEQRMCLIVADVAGKGVPAALYMVITKVIMKIAMLRDVTPERCLYKVNNQLCENNYENMFVTALAAVLDLRTGELSVANAGHNPPLIRRAGADNTDARFEYLKVPPDFVLAGLEDTTYHLTEYKMNPGDSLIMYTDGVTEAESRHRELFGDGRLLASVNESEARGLSAGNMANHISGRVSEFVDGAEQSDDMTLLIVNLRK